MIRPAQFCRPACLIWRNFPVKRGGETIEGVGGTSISFVKVRPETLNYDDISSSILVSACQGITSTWPIHMVHDLYGPALQNLEGVSTRS